MKDVAIIILIIISIIVVFVSLHIIFVLQGWEFST